MKVTKHYIEERKDGSWRWTHIPQGGLFSPKGPKVSEHGQITLNSNQYTVNSQFDRHAVSPRPSWALGLVILGFLGLFGASATAQYLIGAVLFAGIGLLSLVGGILSYSKSYHVYAIFSEGTAMQIPPIRSWIDRAKIDDALQYTSDEMAQDAKSQLAREALNPAMPWGLIIAAAIAGLGGGAVIGVIAAHFPGK